jgi:hypothetical protein
MAWDSSIAFAMEPQDQDQWCWAAAAVSIVRFFVPSSALTQCALAEQVLQLEGCCPKNPTCNKQAALDNVLSQLGHLNFGIPSAAQIETINRELLAGNPVAARIDVDGTGHFVVISAVDLGAQAVRVCDPLATTQTLPYDEVCTRYLGRGTLSETFFTQKSQNQVETAELRVAAAPPAVARRLSAGRRVRRPARPGRAVSAEAALETPIHEVLAAAPSGGEGAGWRSTAAVIAWRKVVLTADGDAFALETSTASPANARSPVGVTRGPYVAETVRLIHTLRAKRRDDVPRALKLLLIPSIHLVALLLQAPSAEDDLFVAMSPAPHGAETGREYRAAEFDALVDELARRQSAENEAVRNA